MKRISDKRKAKGERLAHNSTLAQSSKPIARSTLKRNPGKAGGVLPRKPIAKVNPRRQAKRAASYKQKLAAYRRSETYKIVETRADGQCERLVSVPAGAWYTKRQDRCTVSRAEGVMMTHNHKTYARFGGHELPEDVELLCPAHNAEYESQHSTRRRSR